MPQRDLPVPDPYARVPRRHTLARHANVRGRVGPKHHRHFAQRNLAAFIEVDQPRVDRRRRIHLKPMGRHWNALV